MIQLKESYWRPIEAQIAALWWEHVFGPMFDVLDMKPPVKNVGVSALLDALGTGRIFYDSGVFSGVFDILTSRELSEFATYDGRSNTWIGMPPPVVVAEAARVKFESRRLNERIATMIPKFQDAVDEALKNIAFPMNTVIVDLAHQAQVDMVDMVDLSVMPELTEEAAAALADDYTDNQRLNVKNWSPEQVERLRRVIEQNVRAGYNVNELRALIMAEWNVSANKARFLARQETMLFVSAFRDERYQSAGVEEYVWFSAHDSRCREANKYGGPAHGPGGPLHGHTFRFDNPPRSGTRGEPGNPGTAYGCRCIAKPILPRR